MAKAAQILADLDLPARSWQQPCLIATFGFPGAGKTAIASVLCDHYPLICLTTDSIRLKYNFASGPETLQAMYRVAENLFAQNYSVIFDGIHMMKRNRDEMRHFGATHNAHIQFIHVVAAASVIKQRLDLRAEDVETTTQAGKFVITDEHFQRIISYYEPPDGEPDVIQVDTSTAVSSEKQMASLFNKLDSWVANAKQE